MLILLYGTIEKISNFLNLYLYLHGGGCGWGAMTANLGKQFSSMIYGAACLRNRAVSFYVRYLFLPHTIILGTGMSVHIKFSGCWDANLFQIFNWNWQHACLRMTCFGKGSFHHSNSKEGRACIILPEFFKFKVFVPKIFPSQGEWRYTFKKI